MERLKGAFAILLLAFASIAVAQEHDKTGPNGCGTGWNRYLVPNSIPLLRCKFEEACNAHDTCYAKCEGRLDNECEYRRCRKGGDLHGKIVCETDERLISLGVNAYQRRKTCDKNLYSNIKTLNSDRMSCRAFAVIYRDAVKLFGDSAFIGIDEAPNLTQQQEDYEKAIRDFFANGTEAQFKRIVEEDEAGRKAVDMKRNIRFLPDRGLVNTH